jgi:hypothetical protein
MKHRSHRSPQERSARSQLAQLITEQPFLPGALVWRARSCGKPTCRCQQGHLHRSLYLAVRHQGKRALIYLPRALHETARQWLDNGRRLRRQLDQLGQLQLDQLLERKQALLRKKPKRLTTPEEDPAP